jgi:acetyltransferase-like isoleucine patch superfamily enzyme
MWKRFYRGKHICIGANAVVKQGITIGRNCMIGAGSVIIKNVPDNSTIVGNPGKIIKNKK